MQTLTLALIFLSLQNASAIHKNQLPAFFGSSSCDASIPGVWGGQFPPSPPLGDSYQLSWDPSRGPGAWRATGGDGVGWGVALGMFGPGNATVSLSFDSGVKLTGNVSKGCTQMDFNENGSRCFITPPPPPPISTVHIVAMK